MKKKVVTDPISEEIVTTEPEVEAPVKENKKVEKVEAEVVTKGKVTARMLNVRKGPSTETLPIGTLNFGDTIEYTIENDTWLKLINGGYVMKQFVK